MYTNSKIYTDLTIKNNFWAKKRIVLFVPEKKNRKAFFITLINIDGKPQKWLKSLKRKKWLFDLVDVDYGFGGPFTLKLSAYPQKIIGLTPQQKSFRDKYYFDLSDLKAKGIPEPKPMWDSKVKPYKNVFGEELLD